MGNKSSIFSADNISGHDKAYEEQENAIKKMLAIFTRIGNANTAALAGLGGTPVAVPVIQEYKQAPTMATLGNYNNSFHTK
jgi:hypothetical protein